MLKKLLKIPATGFYSRPLPISIQATNRPSFSFFKTCSLSPINTKPQISQIGSDIKKLSYYSTSHNKPQLSDFSHTVIFHQGVLYLYEKKENHTWVQIDSQKTCSHHPSYKILNYLSYLVMKIQKCVNSMQSQRTKSKQHMRELTAIKSLLLPLKKTVHRVDLQQYIPSFTSIYKGVERLIASDSLSCSFHAPNLIISTVQLEHMAFQQLTKMNYICLNWINKKILNPSTTRTLVTSFNCSKTASLEKRYVQWVYAQYGNFDPENSGHLSYLSVPPEQFANTTLPMLLDYLKTSKIALETTETELGVFSSNIIAQILSNLNADVLEQFATPILCKFSLLPQFSNTNYASQNSELLNHSNFFMKRSESQQIINSSSLRQRIHEKLSKAQAGGKKILIISGENHYRIECREINLMLMSICSSEFNIKSLAIESDLPYSIFCHPKPNLNYKRYIFKAKQEQWDIIPVDKYLHEIDESINKRDRGIIEWLLLKVHSHALLLVGAHHLYGLNNPQLKERFEILFVNTCFNAYPKTYPQLCIPEDQETLEVSKEHLWVNDPYEVLSLFSTRPNNDCEVQYNSPSKM